VKKIKDNDPMTRSPDGQIPDFLVGVISDTHGLLRPQALEALAGSQLVVHAGDIGSPDILPTLARLAPIEAVRGNVDTEDWARAIPETAVVEVQGRTLYVLHDVKQLDLDPRAAGFATVISGHSHVPAKEMRKGVLYFNPGSAGPKRFRLPVSVGRLWVGSKGIRAEIVMLDAR
jgi:putative phosphoesterase